MKRKGKNCNSFFDAALAMSGVIVTAVVFSAGTVSGSEWNTASGHHCIDVCRYSESENLFHWCRTADRNSLRKWDYCTPTRSLVHRF